MSNTSIPSPASVDSSDPRATIKTLPTRNSSSENGRHIRYSRRSIGAPLSPQIWFRGLGNGTNFFRVCCSYVFCHSCDFAILLLWSIFTTRYYRDPRVEQQNNNFSRGKIILKIRAQGLYKQIYNNNIPMTRAVKKGHTKTPSESVTLPPSTAFHCLHPRSRPSLGPCRRPWSHIRPGR